MPDPAPVDTRLRDWPYLLGVAGYTICDTFLQTWLTIYFVPSPDRGLPLVDPDTFGTAFLVARVLEAIANPLVGLAAERSGRHWAFLGCGALAFAGVGALLFFLARPGNPGFNTALLFGLLPVMTIGQAFFIVPYLGLIPRVAGDSRRQLALTNTQALIILVSVLVGQVLSGAAIGLLGGSVPVAALVFLGTAVALMTLAAVAVRALKVVAQPAFRPREMLQILVENRGFALLVAALFVFWLGFSMVRTAAPYFVTVLLGEPKEKASLYLGILFVTTLLAVVATRFFAPRFGLRRMMIAANVLFALFLPLLATVGLPVGGLAPVLWALFAFALLGAPLGILSALQNPLVAEQAEADARRTGQVRGALFFGVQGFLIKVSYGLAARLLGFLQATFGYTTAQPLGIQLIGPLAGTLAFVAMILYFFYPNGRAPGLKTEATDL